jgi:hypothetical protein
MLVTNVTWLWCYVASETFRSGMGSRQSASATKVSINLRPIASPCVKLG